MLKNNEPILGVIYAPAVNGIDNFTNEFNNTFDDIENDVVPNTWVKESLDELGDFQGTLYFAASGVAVYKAVGSALFKLSGQSSITQSNKLTAVSSRSHSSEDEKRKLEELGVHNFVSVGSSLKFCLVAEGKAQIYFRNGPTMEWDVGAGYSIAKESGAEIKGLSFNKENLLNSSFSVIKK